MTSRQVVLVIVEGPSDDSALNVLLKRCFDQKAFFVHVTHGDVTSDKYAHPSNIAAKVYSHISKNMNRNHYRKKDISQVIHLMDTDGAYIDDSDVIEIPTAERTIYSTTNIMCPNRRNITERNARKAANMNALAACDSISGVPYRAIYFSCNLDHVLHNKLNSDDEVKEHDAFEFARRYRNDIPKFVDFISNSPFSVTGSHEDTWAFIREGRHSLERHTNLGICLPSPISRNTEG